MSANELEAVPAGQDETRELWDEYNRRVKGYSELCDAAERALSAAIRGAGLNVHSVTSRVKSWDSFIGRIQRKQDRKPWDQVEDLAGVRVVCLYRDTMTQVEDVLTQRFDVLKVEHKDEDGGQFGYEDWHHIVRIPQTDAWPSPDFDELRRLKCEIQVRTIGMDAWDSVSHHIAYKDNDSLPPDLKPVFHVLSGLFRIADDLFTMFRHSGTAWTETVEKQVASQDKPDELPLNQDTLRAYLQEGFPSRPVAPDNSVLGLLSLLREAGYGTVGAVRNRRESAAAALEDYETQVGALSHESYNQAAALCNALALADGNFRRVMFQKHWHFSQLDRCTTDRLRNQFAQFAKQHHLDGA